MGLKLLEENYTAAHHNATLVHFHKQLQLPNNRSSSGGIGRRDVGLKLLQRAGRTETDLHRETAAHLCSHEGAFMIFSGIIQSFIVFSRCQMRVRRPHVADIHGNTLCNWKYYALNANPLEADVHHL